MKHTQLKSNPDEKVTVFWLFVIYTAHQENFDKDRMKFKFKLNNKDLTHK